MTVLPRCHVYSFTSVVVAADGDVVGGKTGSADMDATQVDSDATEMDTDDEIAAHMAKSDRDQGTNKGK